MASPLDRHRQLALVAGTRTRLTTSLDLSPIGDEPSQEIRLLIVYLHPLGAEKTFPHPRATGCSIPSRPLLLLSLL